MSGDGEMRVDFSRLRYAQCWEDADVLLDGLDIQPGETCLTVASAGDNTLSMLTRSPARVIAVDLSPAQLAALELRVAAYRELSHPELLELIGSRPSTRRASLYARCSRLLSADSRRFWDSQSSSVANGIGGAGKFERYLSTFRRCVLPLIHSHGSAMRLLQSASVEERTRFYHERWDTTAWRALFRAFFSERVLGWLGRDPSFFRYASDSVAEHLLARVRYALTVLDPASNPYLQWILMGEHGPTLPHALRAENFDAIRNGLDRIEWHRTGLENLLNSGELPVIDRMNLSDVFEYMSATSFCRVLGKLAGVARSGARMVYWNMIVRRSGAEAAPDCVRALTTLSHDLFQRDKVFFYSAVCVEEVR